MIVVTVAMRPLEEATVVANVHLHGVGALNTLASAVPTWNGHGRFPPNLLLEHQSECRQIGTVRVRSPGADNHTKHKVTHGVGVVGWGHSEGSVYRTHREEDGMETLPAWGCVSGCPVGDVDSQAAGLPSAGVTTATHASRYFRQVKS